MPQYEPQYEYWRVLQKKNHPLINPAEIINDLHAAEDHINFLNRRLSECESLLAEANEILAGKINEVTDLRLRLRSDAGGF